MNEKRKKTLQDFPEIVQLEFKMNLAKWKELIAIFAEEGLFDLLREFRDAVDEKLKLEPKESQ